MKCSRVRLIDPATSFAAKSRLVFSCQMDTERKRVTRIIPSAEPINPVIANTNTSRSQGIISRERSIGARVIVAPREAYVAVSIEDFATSLRISAQYGGFAGYISDDNLPTVPPQ